MKGICLKNRNIKTQETWEGRGINELNDKEDMEGTTEKNGEDVLNLKVSSVLAENYSWKPDLRNGLMTSQCDYRIKNVGDLWRSLIETPAQSRVSLDKDG